MKEIQNENNNDILRVNNENEAAVNVDDNAQKEEEKENELAKKNIDLQNQLNEIHKEEKNNQKEVQKDNEKKNDPVANENIPKANEINPGVNNVPVNDKQTLEQQMQQMRMQMMQMQQTIMQQQAMLAQQGIVMQGQQPGQQMQQQNAQHQFQQPKPAVRQNQPRMQSPGYVNLNPNPNNREEVYRSRVRNADDIRLKLQADIVKFEETAKKAKSGKYDKQVTPGGMKPKYYYAAVRDYHKDLMKKINALPSDELKKKYYQKYYNQETMDKYVRFRVKDPVYRNMVDKYSSKKVLDSYEKFSKIRKKPTEFGFIESGEMSKGVVPAAEHVQIDTKSFVYDDNEYEAGSAWEKFRKEALEYNKLINERHAKGDEGATADAIKDKADSLFEKAEAVKDAYGKDWRGRGADFVQEAGKVQEYLEDVEKYGPYAANLRKTLREKVEAGKGLDGGYDNQLELADMIVAKKFLADTPYTKQYWNQFKQQEGGPDPKETYEKATKQIETARKQVLGDPAFNVCLSQNYPAKNFEKNYNTMVRDRGVKEIMYKDREAYRRAQASQEFKKRAKKQREKENKEYKSNQEKVKKLKSLGK